MSLRFLSAKSDKPKKTTQVLPRTAPLWFFLFFLVFLVLCFFWFLFFSLLFVMQKIFVCWSNVCQRVEFLHLPKVCLDWHAFYVHFAHARAPLFCIFSTLPLIFQHFPSCFKPSVLYLILFKPRSSIPYFFKHEAVLNSKVLLLGGFDFPPIYTKYLLFKVCDGHHKHMQSATDSPIWPNRFTFTNPSAAISKLQQYPHHLTGGGPTKM